MTPPPRPAAERVLFGLVLAFSGAASGLTLACAGYGTLALLPPVWHAAMFRLVGVRPLGDAGHRRAVLAGELLALPLGAWMLFNMAASLLDGHWADGFAPILVGLLAARLPSIRTAKTAESVLLAALALALFASASLPRIPGVLTLAAFLLPALATMALATPLVAIEDARAAGWTAGAPPPHGRVLASGALRSLPVLALGLAAFLAVQDRFEHPLFRFPGSRAAAMDVLHMPGWQRAAELGGRDSRPSTKGTELMRIRAPRWLARYRLHAFNMYEGAGWNARWPNQGLFQRLDDPGAWGEAGGLPRRPYRFEVEVLAEGHDTFLTAGIPSVVDAGDAARAGIYVDPLGTVRPVWGHAISRGRRYTVRGAVPVWDDPAVESRLAAPSAPVRGDEGTPMTSPPRIAEFARSTFGGEASPWLRSLAAARWLRSNKAFSWNPAADRARHGVDPVESFLFDSPAGNCLDFASALALMARALDAPSRLVTGFLGHRYDESRGEWVITEADGHAWCEIRVAGVGWVPLDPVPPTSVNGLPAGGPPDARPATRPASSIVRDAERPVVRRIGRAITRHTGLRVSRAGLLRRLQRSVRWVVAGLILLLLLRSGRTRWRERRYAGIPGPLRARLDSGPEPVRWFLRACAAAGRRGVPWEDARTAREHGDVIAMRFPDTAGPVQALAAGFTRATWGGDAGLPAAHDELRRSGQRVLAGIRNGPVAPPAAPEVVTDPAIPATFDLPPAGAAVPVPIAVEPVSILPYLLGFARTVRQALFMHGGPAFVLATGWLLIHAFFFVLLDRQLPGGTALRADQFNLEDACHVLSGFIAAVVAGAAGAGVAAVKPPRRNRAAFLFVCTIVVWMLGALCSYPVMKWFPPFGSLLNASFLFFGTVLVIRRLPRPAGLSPSES